MEQPPRVTKNAKSASRWRSSSALRPEQAWSWCRHLEDKLRVPFPARCIAQHAVLAAPSRRRGRRDCRDGSRGGVQAFEMFVLTRWERPDPRGPPCHSWKAWRWTSRPAEAIEDWHYWVGRSYEL